MVYDLINPCDYYTLEARNLQLAAAAALVIGGGRYGVRSCDNDEDEMPCFVLGGADVWMKENGIDSLDRFLAANRAEVADVLESVMLASEREREGIRALLSCVADPKERERAKLAWHNAMRSSTKNIGAYAWQCAQQLRSKPSAAPIAATAAG